LFKVLFKLNHRDEFVHTLHLRTWLRSQGKPHETHFNAMIFACVSFPRNRWMHESTATVLERHERYQDAIDILDHYLRAAPDPDGVAEVQERIDSLKQRLPGA
jgi:hypothetical protein